MGQEVLCLYTFTNFVYFNWAKARYLKCKPIFFENISSFLAPYSTKLAFYCEMSTNLVSSSWVFSWIRCSTSRPIPENKVLILLKQGERSKCATVLVLQPYLESCSLTAMQKTMKASYYKSWLNISFVHCIIPTIHSTMGPLLSTLNIQMTVTEGTESEQWWKRMTRQKTSW